MIHETPTLSGARKRIRESLKAARLDGETDADYLARQVRTVLYAYGVEGRELAALIGDHPSNISRALHGALVGRPSTVARLRSIGIRTPKGESPKKVCHKA